MLVVVATPLIDIALSTLVLKSNYTYSLDILWIGFDFVWKVYTAYNAFYTVHAYRVIIFGFALAGAVSRILFVWPSLFVKKLESDPAYPVKYCGSGYWQVIQF